MAARLESKVATTCTPPPAYVPPVMVYEHGANDENGCSITGGYVYRGSSFANLQGVYLYADFCRGKIWGLKRDASNRWISTLAADTDFKITSFGEDEQGELVLFDYSGTLYRIAQAPVLSATKHAVAAEDEAATTNDAAAFGLANWRFYSGDRDGAREILASILKGEGWASFGFIAAEAAWARNFAGD